MSKKSTRQAYGEALVELGRINNDIVVLDADLSKSTKTDLFKKEFPKRHLNIGIAEADLIGTAAGFATCGKSHLHLLSLCLLLEELLNKLEIL